MPIVPFFLLSFVIGAIAFAIAIRLAKIPESRTLSDGADVHALKRFHDERSFEVLKLFIQIILAFAAGLGFISINMQNVPVGLRETSATIVAGSGYLLATVVTIHKCSKVWASGQGYLVSLLSSELFTVPGMVALTSVMAFRLIPVLIAR